MALEKLNKAARRITSRLGGDSGVVVTLKGEHAEIAALMRRVDDPSADVDARRESYASLREALLQHARAEMEVFYPACQAYPALRTMVRDDLAEHDQVEERLAVLDVTDPASPDWMGHVALLREPWSIMSKRRSGCSRW